MILSVSFAVWVALFWSLSMVCMLSFHEQYQLFLFTSDYFLSRICLPGGLADYLAEFVTQFNYIPALGAVLIALLFFALQRLTWSVSQRLGADGSWYALSFLPAITLWIYQSDSSVMQSLTIALIATLATIRLLISPLTGEKTSSETLIVTLLVVPPVFYWLFGTAVYIVALAMLLLLLQRRHWLLAGLAVVYTMALVYASTYLLAYPASRLLIGLHYYRYPVSVPIMQWVVMALTLLTPLVISRLPRKRMAIPGVATAILVFALAFFGVRGAYNSIVQEHIEYDYLVRMEQWDAIIRKAEKDGVTTPMTVSIVNLALSQEGELLDRMFEFYQNGEQGLFPSFSRDILSPISTAEIFFRLGMINDCLRYCFEVGQSIPDFQRSGRLTKRITQCEVANGEYKVARRYLLLLRHSLFYRDWAKKTNQLIRSEEAVNADPTYQRLRSIRETREDYLFSDTEMDQMVGLLLMSNPKNSMAFEYLMACVLLRRDVQHCLEYLPLINNVGLQRVPTALQQVVIGQWLKTHSDVRGIPCKVDAYEVNLTSDFLRRYTTDRNDPRLSLPPYSTNVWHYILFNN